MASRSTRTSATEPGTDTPVLDTELSTAGGDFNVASHVEQAFVQASNSRPTNVVQAIACVMAEIGGVPRMTQEQRKKAGMHVESGEGVSYAYRGIDQIAAAAQPLMGRYGVVIIPNVVQHLAEPVVKGNATLQNTKWYRQQVTVDWQIYGPGGVEDVLSARTIGVGDDNSDKGMNKAMTTAYKNLLLRLLCIGDPSDDTDHNSAKDTGHPDEVDDPFITDAEAQEVVDAVLALPDDRKAAAKVQIAERFGSTKQIHVSQWNDVLSLMRMWTTGETAETPSPDPIDDDADQRRADLAARKLAEAGLASTVTAETDEERATREAADEADREWVQQATDSEHLEGLGY